MTFFTRAYNVALLTWTCRRSLVRRHPRIWFRTCWDYLRYGDEA